MTKGQSLNPETQKALARGTTDGSDMLLWMRAREMDRGAAVAALAWTLALLVHQAEDEAQMKRLVGGFQASVDLYLNFFQDMEDEEFAAKVHAAAETETEGSRH